VTDDDRRKEERLKAIMDEIRPGIRRLSPDMPHLLFEETLRRLAIHRLIDEDLRPDWER
jgi:hypothetical protein